MKSSCARHLESGAGQQDFVICQNTLRTTQVTDGDRADRLTTPHQKQQWISEYKPTATAGHAQQKQQTRRTDQQTRTRRPHPSLPKRLAPPPTCPAASATSATPPPAPPPRHGATPTTAATASAAAATAPGRNSGQ